MNDIITYFEKTINQIPSNAKKEEIILYGYFISIYELVNDINILFEKQRLENIPILMRSLLETYIDMKLISINHKYIQTLILSANIEEQKKLNQILEDKTIKNEDKDIFRSILNNINKEIKDFSGHYENFNIYQKFQKVDLLWVYNQFYRELSTFSHSNIKSIEKRYISLTKNLNVKLKYQKGYSEKYNHFFYLINIFIYDIFEIINNNTLINCSEIIKKLECKINTIEK